MRTTVLAVVVAIALVGCCGPAVVSTTAGPAVPAPVPVRPAAVAWRWTSPAALHEVARAGAGVVVAGDDGVVALDGVSGTERWRYSRPGTRLTALQVTPGGATVVLGYDDEALTVLDAITGTPRWDDPADPATLLVTDDVLVLARADGVGVEQEARDLTSGEVLWTRGTTPGCEQRTLAPQRSVGAVPVAEWCAGRTVLRGRDSRTGRDRWTVDAGPAEASAGSALSSSSDGSLVAVSGPRPRLLVDPRDGTVRARVPRTAGSPLLGEGLPRVEQLQRIVPAVEALDLATGSPVTVPPAPCEGPAVLVLPGSVVQACSEEFADVATVDGGPPIDLGVLAPDDGVPLGRPERAPDDPVLVPAPGAIVVANRSGSTVVVGLR
ncbi:PQQ-binding-like beta-propeller repeat protein [Actinomycetospora atypica]|uniref:PQQ-binding-like beta-propeller repeat protein n=1 Tax=Actinomycetospora atypica TaxID=1290095 RepID=A0ABV9YPJ1_9PSEU